MSMKIQVWLAGVMLMAMGGLINVTSPSCAAQGEKDPAVAAKKIAVEIKAGNTAAATKMAEKIAKDIEEVSELMHLYRPRNKGGLGWSSKEGKNPAIDGLEKKIQEYAKGVPENQAAMVAENVEAATWIQALTEITMHKAPKDMPGGKTKKAWIAYTEEMRTAGTAFAKAAAAKKGPDMAKAASKINATCIGCHSKFKD